VSLPYSKTKATLPLDFVDEPTVFFAAAALAKVQYIVATCSTEAAWLGLVDELDSGDFLITDVFVPEQEVSAAAADIDAGAIAKKVHRDNIDDTKIRYHGHSHVNMHVEPSGVDQHHMEDYLEHFEYIIRTISNKKGEMRVDLFDKRSGFTYQNIGYTIWEMAFTNKELEDINEELKNVKTKQPKFARVENKPLAIEGQKDSQFGWPSAADILEYFSEMTDKEREAELKLLTPDERKNISALLQSAGYTS